MIHTKKFLLKQAINEEWELRVVKFSLAHLDWTQKEIAEHFDIVQSKVSQVCRKHNASRGKGHGKGGIHVKKAEQKKRILAYLVAHPEMSYLRMARRLRTTIDIVVWTAEQNGIFRGKGSFWRGKVQLPGTMRALKEGYRRWRAEQKQLKTTNSRTK